MEHDHKKAGSEHISTFHIYPYLISATMSWKAGKTGHEKLSLTRAGPLYPCNPATARSESTKLAVDPKGEKLIYTNGRAVIVSVGSA